MRGAQGDSSNAIRTDLGAIIVSLELSRSKWVITSLSPGAGEKLSRPADSACPNTPGSRRTTASMSTSAGSSPPLST